MATFFGEVLPVFSRAVREEEEEGREAASHREVRVQWLPENQGATGSCAGRCPPRSALIVAVGPNAVAFVNAFVQSAGDWEVIGTVTLWNEAVEGTKNLAQEFPTDSSCLLYRLTSNPNILTCHCSDVVPEDQLFQWTDKVFASLQKQNLNVIVLSNCSMAEYKSAEPVSGLVMPFLRALKTKEFKDSLCCPLLEQPNIITGLPAAVLSYCQVWHIPAVVYQCHSNVTHLDSETIGAFKPLLSCHIAVPFEKDISRSAEILKKLFENFNVQSNLYT
uniref:Proteasome assembly chaperone 1 n=1 Tax=Callorhinchus milii TaxID=7868 RepID=V9L7P1_CALMI